MRKIALEERGGIDRQIDIQAESQIVRQTAQIYIKQIVNQTHAQINGWVGVEMVMDR